MTAGQQQALDDLLSAIDMRVAETLDEPATSSRTDDAVGAGWNVNFGILLDDLRNYTEYGNTSAAAEYRSAIADIVNEVLAAHARFAAEGDELSPSSRHRR